MSLHHLSAYHLLPTPTTQEAENMVDLTESGRRLTKDGTDSHSLNLGRMATMGLLKTPTKMDGEVTSGKKNPVSGDSGTLAQEIMSGYEPTMQKLGLIQTPRANESTESMETIQARRERTGNGMMNLTAIANQLMPTPAAQDSKNATLPPSKIERNTIPGAILRTGQTGQLSPHFVLEMMGFPPDWTELPFLNGETNQ